MTQTETMNSELWGFDVITKLDKFENSQVCEVIVSITLYHVIYTVLQGNQVILYKNFVWHKWALAHMVLIPTFHNNGLGLNHARATNFHWSWSCIYPHIYVFISQVCLSFLIWVFWNWINLLNFFFMFYDLNCTLQSLFNSVILWT